MDRTYAARSLTRLARCLGVAALLLFGSAARATAASRDFDAVSWVPIGCSNPNLISHTSPANVDFVGDASFPPTYYAFDATYLYFRYRLDGNPASASGFAQNSWTALMQVPTG